MRVAFRQGIVSHQPGGFLQYNSSGNVDILADNRDVTLTIAEKDTNYTFTENATRLNAWMGPFAASTTYWLYWRFDTQTFKRTYGSTIVEPYIGASQPSKPATGQIWYKTTTNEMFYHSGSGWLKALIVFAGTVQDNTFASYSISAPEFTGTQIGNTHSVRSGRPLYTASGRVIRKDNNTFFTTEDQIFINDSQSAAIRLESNVVVARNVNQAIAEFSVVAFSGAGEIRLAQYNDSQSTITAILMEPLLADQTGVVVPQGIVTNPDWDFTADVGSPLWIDNGTLVSRDPHVSNVLLYPTPRTPVARVLAADSVLFEQGLGGIGPRGLRGEIDGLSPASTSELGGVLLVTTSTTPNNPKVVGDDDPRLQGGPFSSLNHSHNASNLSFTPTADISASTVQEAIEQLNSGANTTGATFTGPLILDQDPTDPLEASTKSYVDTQLLDKADNNHTHAADSITLSQTGNVSATDVQSAIAELDGDKFASTGGTINGNLSVSGTTTFVDNVTIQAALTASGAVTVNNPFTVTTLSTLDDVTINGVATLKDDTSVTGTLSVIGDSTITGNSSTDGNVDVGGDVTLSGNTQLIGAVTVDTTLDVTGTTTLSGDVNISGDTVLGSAPTTDLSPATKKYVDDTFTNSQLAELPYDLPFFMPGPAASVAGELVGLIVVARTITIKAGVVNLFGTAISPPQTQIDFEFIVNSNVIGTATFAPGSNGGTKPTFNFPVGVTISAGDAIEVRPRTQELNIADVCLTIAASSTDLTTA